jgi:hypothetical protein
MPSSCATRRLCLFALLAHLGVHAINCSFGANEALEVGLDEHLKRGRLLLDRVGEELEAGEQHVGRGIAVDLREEELRGECGRAEEEAIAYVWY